MAAHKKIFASEYGDGANNFDINRFEDEIHVTLTYPPWNDAENKNQVRYVVFDQESVRASDGIRVSYDYGRDGYKIEQSSTFSWDASDAVCDPDWQEVAFIQAWAREKPGEP